MHSDAYYRLAGMTALSFVSMYVLMYAMVDRPDNVFNSINQIYMAGLMTAPMVVLELVLMGSMYPNSNFNRLVIAVAAVAGCVLFLMIRQQMLIGDRQFLRSMIPHHAGAVLMCEKANLQSTDIKTLCASIISGQNAELDRMKEILKR